MADYYINVILDEAKKATINGAGLADEIVNYRRKRGGSGGDDRQGVQKTRQRLFRPHL